MPESVNPAMMAADQGDDAADAAQDQSKAQGGNQGADDQGNAGAGPDTNTDNQDKGGDAGAGDEDAGETKLYELPDGRKVDAETLAKEWKENFMPDYTKKSQIVGAAEKAGIDLSKINSDQGNKPTPKWKDPNWVPENNAELVQATLEAVEEKNQQQRAAEEAVRKEATDAVNNQLTQIKEQLKKADPKAQLDETLLFQHANKYQFADLVAAFQNMQDMKKAVTKTEQRVKQNLQNREADPIAGRPGAGAADEGIDYGEVSQNSGGVFGAVASYLERTGKK